ALVDTLARAARAALADANEQANAPRRADIAAALRAAPLADDTGAFLEARLAREPAPGDSLEAALLASTGPASRATRSERPNTKDSRASTVPAREAAASRRDAARRRLKAELAEAKAERRAAAQQQRDAARDVAHAERALDAARKAASEADAADEHAAALVADLTERLREA
ncbi:MAG: hypothetical protein JWN72_1649, partial [Thermoleophilia bacterium]|nr:hypothetical protein [Thermoleophilia bacterium]